MEFRCTFKQMDSSNALREYAEQKISSDILKFVSKPIEVQFVFSAQHLDRHAHMNLIAGDGFNIQVEQSDKDMYVAIDKMVDKLEVQLKRHKEKLKDHKAKDAQELKMSQPMVKPELSDDAVDAAEVLKYEQSRIAHRAELGQTV